MVEIDEGLLRDILSRYQGRVNELIPMLLEVQENFSYLPEEAIKSIAGFIDIPEGNIYSVSSFYSQFRLTPVGRQHVTVCRGTACHVRGAPQILSELEREIGIAEGETSDDLEYTLESVACIGCCALAPCLKVNANVHGEMTAQKVEGLFAVEEAS
jgi:NADH-quinone oxidoreductase subunit E